MYMGQCIYDKIVALLRCGKVHPFHWNKPVEIAVTVNAIIFMICQSGLAPYKLFAVSKDLAISIIQLSRSK